MKSIQYNLTGQFHCVFLYNRSKGRFRLLPRSHRFEIIYKKNTLETFISLSLPLKIFWEEGVYAKLKIPLTSAASWLKAITEINGTTGTPDHCNRINHSTKQLFGEYCLLYKLVKRCADAAEKKMAVY